MYAYTCVYMYVCMSIMTRDTWHKIVTKRIPTPLLSRRQSGARAGLVLQGEANSAFFEASAAAHVVGLLGTKTAITVYVY